MSHNFGINAEDKAKISRDNAPQWRLVMVIVTWVKNPCCTVWYNSQSAAAQSYLLVLLISFNIVGLSSKRSWNVCSQYLRNYIAQSKRDLTEFTESLFLSFVHWLLTKAKTFSTLALRLGMETLNCTCDKHSEYCFTLQQLLSIRHQCS